MLPSTHHARSQNQHSETPPSKPTQDTREMGIDKDWRSLDKRKFFGFGSLSIFVVRAIVYPFSLAKTKMQVGQTSTQRVGTTMVNVVKTEGLSALYRGFPVSIVGAIPAQLVYISAYELAKSTFKEHVTGMEENRLNIASNLVGGACASLASQFVVVPVDVLTQRLMIQKGLAQNGWSLAKSIVQAEGFRGLYRGYFPSLTTYLPSSSIWWATNASVRHFLASNFRDGPTEQQFDYPVAESAYLEYPIIPKTRLGKSTSEIAQLAISGMVAGAVSAIATHPMDTIKTQFQTRQSTHRNGSEWAQMKLLAKEVWVTQGWRGFTRGIRARVMASMLPSTLLIFSYELVKNLSAKT
jgi:solute carrier family 25 protein 44